jgi:NAD(P)-dependent dehydrogenase (short-subunit alcohol dehydrogenase family)
MALTLTFPEGGALVTGGTGTVGEGIVRALCAAEVPLVFTYVSRPDKAEALVAELRGAGHDVEAVRMAMSDTATISAAFDRVIERHGRVHTVSCGSGVPVLLDRLADFTVEQVEQFMWNDALGYYRVFREAVHRMRASGGGSITTCTTMASTRVVRWDGISPLSKGSVEALMRQTAAEEVGHGIRANSVAIGWVARETMSHYRAMLDQGVPTDPQNFDERMIDLLAEIDDRLRIQRPGTPAEAGNVFAFLASDQASYVNGQSIVLDGGTTL